MHPAVVSTQIEQGTTSDSSRAAKIRDQSWEIMKQYYIDRAVLWQAYANQPAHEELLATGQDTEYFDGQAGAQGWRYGDYELEVFPDDTDECISFAIFDAEEPAFTPPLDRTVVHLFLPFPSPDATVAECTRNDEIYWINGNQVVAAGIIEHVLYEDITISRDGLFVPVAVKPFAYRFKAFSVSDAIDDDNKDAYDAFVADRANANTKLKIIQPAPRNAPIPRIAVEIDRLLGHDLLCYIDDRSREAEARDDAGN